MAEIPKKSFSIRDPVHGYLEIAGHERLVIDHPITQRLRRITQTGLAELVFPEARTSRLVHSLGAMHLTSRFLLSCIEHAEEDVVVRFFEELKQIDILAYNLFTIEELDPLLEATTRTGAGGLLAARVVFRPGKLRDSEKEYKRLLILAESGLRLAALFHDLGHLPFSHDFEYALKDYVAETIRGNNPISPEFRHLLSDTPHEKIGHRLADLVFRALVKETSSRAEQLAFLMAQRILDHEESYETAGSLAPRVGALGWLHSIVDGEVDVDRADYLLRDGRALGLDFASYDLDRLVAALRLVDDPELGYSTAIEERGLTALESFLLTRSRTNQVLVRHHKIAQIAGALRYASAFALKQAQADEFKDILQKLLSDGGLDRTRASDILERFARHDEAWWTEVLRGIDQTTTEGSVLKSCLDLILRRGRRFVSVWKRKGDLDQDLRKFLNSQVSKGSSAPAEFETARAKLLSEKNTMLVIHRFTPYKLRAGTKKSVIAVLTKNGLQPASELSNLISSLEAAWSNDIHFHAFTLEGNHISAEEISSYLPQQSQK